MIHLSSMFCKADVHPAPQSNTSSRPPELRAPSCPPKAPLTLLPSLSYSPFNCTNNTRHDKVTKKSLPWFFFLKHFLQGNRNSPLLPSPSAPRSSLALYKGTNHRTGTKQIRAATVNHGKNKGLTELLPLQGCQ